jgi:hypothetical protein
MEEEANLVSRGHGRLDDSAPDAQRAMSKRAGSTVAEVRGSHADWFARVRAFNRARSRGDSVAGILRL